MQKPIKILFAFSSAQLWGGEIAWLRFLSGLDRNRFCPSVLVFGEGLLIERLKEINIGYYQLQKARIRNIATYFIIFLRLRSFLKKERFDLINSLGVNFMLSLCLLSLRSVNIIHVHTIHRLPIIDRWCLGRADLIICPSNFSKNFLCGYGLKPQRIRVIYNGINPQEESTQEQKTSLRRELGLDEGVPLVCYAGRIVKWKNLEMLIRAIAKVRQSCFCGAKFIFAGDTPQVPANRLDYRQGLLKLAKNLRVEKDIIFIGRRQDMQNIFSQIDIFVIPSLLEVCSMAILEAMACAKPVVALNSGGNPELVSETAGILVKPGDIAGFGKAISDLLNDTERSRRMGREAKAQIAAKFSLDKNIKELEDAMLCVL